LETFDNFSHNNNSISSSINLRLMKTAANKMFLQWCRDELVLSFIFVQRFRFGDRTRLRKGTTAETQTLWLMPSDENIT
jgi:hypothetical protein